jgi:hypothetical protein
LEASERVWQNQRPKAEEVQSLAEQMRAARNLLSQTADVAEHVSEMMRTKLAAAAKAIVKADGELPPADLALAREVLLDASHQPLRVPEEQLDRSYEMPAWSPIPHTEAAQGLPWLIVRGRDEEVLDAIDALAESREPSVRFLTATELFRLRWGAEDRFWALIDRFVEREQSGGVLTGLLQSLGRIKREDAPKVASALERLALRGFIPDERSQYGEAYAQLVAWLAFNIGDAWANKTLTALAAEPLANVAFTQRMAFEALTIITPEFLQDERVRPMSLRAAEWIRSLLAGTIKKAPDAIAPNADPEVTKAAYSIIDDIAARIYFSARPDKSSDDRDPASDLEEYFEIVRPLVGDVIAFGKVGGATLLARTAHHLMEFLHMCLPLDPPGVLHLAAEVVGASEKAGYSLDAMAVKEVVAIAEELLADHRASISEGRSLEDFVRLLDAFANAGWPEALRLIWRIDEIFR